MTVVMRQLRALHILMLKTGDKEERACCEG